MSATLVILGLLSEKPSHGYQLQQEAKRRVYDRYINMSGGSLYYNLGRLERAGYVAKSDLEQQGRYPVRQVYRITSKGREHFRHELLRLLFDTEEREKKIYDPLNAALAFGHFLDAAELREGLQRHLDWARQRLAWIGEQQAYWAARPTTMLVHTKLIEHGLRRFRAEVAWLEQFLDELAASTDREENTNPTLDVAAAE